MQEFIPPDHGLITKSNSLPLDFPIMSFLLWGSRWSKRIEKKGKTPVGQETRVRPDFHLHLGYVLGPLINCLSESRIGWRLNRREQTCFFSLFDVLGAIVTPPLPTFFLPPPLSLVCMRNFSSPHSKTTPLLEVMLLPAVLLVLQLSSREDFSRPLFSSFFFPFLCHLHEGQLRG